MLASEQLAQLTARSVIKYTEDAIRVSRGGGRSAPRGPTPVLGKCTECAEQYALWNGWKGVISPEQCTAKATATGSAVALKGEYGRHQIGLFTGAPMHVGVADTETEIPASVSIGGSAYGGDIKFTPGYTTYAKAATSTIDLTKDNRGNVPLNSLIEAFPVVTYYKVVVNCATSKDPINLSVALPVGAAYTWDNGGGPNLIKF